MNYEKMVTITIWMFSMLMALIAMVVTAPMCEGAIQQGRVVILKGDKAVPVNPEEAMEGLLKLNAHHCALAFLSNDPNDIIQAVASIERSGVKVLDDWVILDASNAKSNELRVASAFGNMTVYGLRCEIRKGPGKSWMRQNVYDRLIVFAISSLTGGLFGGGWGGWGSVIGLNQLVNPNNVNDLIWR